MVTLWGSCIDKGDLGNITLTGLHTSLSSRSTTQCPPAPSLSWTTHTNITHCSLLSYGNQQKGGVSYPCGPQEPGCQA